MSGLLGKRAVVIRAGIGGLSMAAAWAKYFEHVEIFERDHLTSSVASRSGTLQDRHLHGLPAGGLRKLNKIFPSFEKDLAGAGAVSISVAQDTQLERPDVSVLPRRNFGLSLLCASRPLMALVARRRTEAIANITLWPGCRITAIVPYPAARAPAAHLSAAAQIVARHCWSRCVMQFVSHGSQYGGASSRMWYGLAALGAAVWLSVAACHAQSSPTGARFPSHVPVTRAGSVVNGHRIQPRADEFNDPLGQRDVSTQDARDVDRIFDELMHRSREQCLSARLSEGATHQC
jgi:hypothetical protein